MSDPTLLLCYDGSEFAKRAIARAPSLLAARDAVVLVVWQPSALVSWAWAGAGGVGGVDISEVDNAEQAAAQRLAEEGAALAEAAGLRASAETARAEGPVWDAIVGVANERDVSAIVVGSRGLTGLRSVLLGSVSEGVTRHAHRTTVVVQHPAHAHAKAA